MPRPLRDVVTHSHVFPRAILSPSVGAMFIAAKFTPELFRSHGDLCSAGGAFCSSMRTDLPFPVNSPADWQSAVLNAGGAKVSLIASINSLCLNH